MPHSLNLYDAASLAPSGHALPLAPLLLAGGAALLALGVAGWGSWKQGQLQDRLAAATAGQARLRTAADAGGDRVAVTAALAQAAQRSEQTLQQWQGLDSVGQEPGAARNIGSTAGATALQWFKSLAAVSHDGVWLTRVQANAFGAFRLEGRAQDGVALSSYLERWRDEPLLAGTALQTLEMRRGGSDGAGGEAAARADGALVITLSNLAAGRPFSSSDAPQPQQSQSQSQSQSQPQPQPQPQTTAAGAPARAANDSSGGRAP